MKLVTPPESITHLHLLSVLVTEIASKRIHENKLLILDAGCGNGHFLTFLQLNLVSIFPELEFEIYGYDVADHGVQSKDFFSKTIDWCEQHCPDVRWQERLKLICHDDSWPFESLFFDIVLSNQVLEHVWNHKHFFSEHVRVLKKGGMGVHLFPLKHYIYEGHLLLPFVHRISDWYVLKSYIVLLSKLGLGKYRDQESLNIDEFSEKHADYMTFYTNYLSHSELLKVVKQSQLRPSFKYTNDFYWHKVRQLLGKDICLNLDHCHKYVSPLYWFSYHVLKYVSSVTLFVEKENTYGRL